MDGVVFDRAHSAVAINGEFYRLTDIEFLILRRLVEEDGGMVYTSDLVHDTFGLTVPATNHALRQHIYKLNKKIGKGHVVNTYGWGYRFVM